MNTVYIETASRIYAALCSAKHSGPSLLANEVEIARYSFEAAQIFMVEYEKQYSSEQVERQMQQHPGAVIGCDPLEIR